METMHVDPDIEVAYTIPSQFYTSPDWYEKSREKIFASTWQFCLADEDVRLPGQLMPFTLLPGMLDEPLLFIRDTEDQLNCYSNVCTHRGNMLVESPCIEQQQIRCRYHGRRFKLSGEFLHMPEFEQTKNFPGINDNLSKIQFEKFNNFIFSSLSPYTNFEEVFADIQQRLSWFPFAEMRFDANRSRDYLVKCHWALYCENYLEGLHIPFVHKSLRNVIDYGSYSTEIFKYVNLQLALSNGDDGFDLPKDAHDYGKKVAAYYYWIFPNTMLNFYPWGCSVNVVKPLSPSLTKVSFLTYVLDESKIAIGAGAELDKVEREDEAVVETVQKGIRSRFYNKGRYSSTREQGIHHFHRLLCDFLNR